MGNSHPSSAYRELGGILRRIREQAGLTAGELARSLAWSSAMVSRMETGRRASSTTEVIQYVVKCGVMLPEAEPLVDLVRTAECDQGYYISDARIGGSLQSLIFHESSASRSIIYEPLVIPGLLQTSGLARALVTAVHPDADEDLVAGVVRTRLERQRILYVPDPPRFTFYIHEQALRLQIGTDKLMYEQLLHIVLTSALDNVAVRIVPSAARERSVFGSAFRLMEFCGYRPIVYLDNLGGGGLILEESRYVRSYQDLMPILADVALDEGQSREFAAGLADAYDRGSREVAADILAQEQL